MSYENHIADNYKNSNSNNTERLTWYDICVCINDAKKDILDILKSISHWNKNSFVIITPKIWVTGF